MSDEQTLSASNADRAYDSLSKFLEEIGFEGYQAGKRAHVKAGRKAETFRYTPTADHLEGTQLLRKYLPAQIPGSDEWAGEVFDWIQTFRTRGHR